MGKINGVVESGSYDDEWDYLITMGWSDAGETWYFTHVWRKGETYTIEHTSEILNNYSLSLAEAKAKIPEIIEKRK